jgi:uncharacterized protein (TIGR02285 family)
MERDCHRQAGLYTLKMKKMILIVLPTVLISLPAFSNTRAGSSQDPLLIYYFHRPPYYVERAGGEPTGFLVEITRMIFQKADIPCKFVPMPPKRILLRIRQKEYSCSVGWFKTPERELFASFSSPIYRNKPLCIVMRKSQVSAFPEEPSLQQVFESGLTLGVIDSFSYGAWVDDRIAKLRPALYKSTGTQNNLLKMILKSRLDYMLIAPEEAQFIFVNNKEMRDNLKCIRMAGAP